MDEDAYDFEKEKVRRHGDRRKRCRQDDFDWKTRFQVKEAGTQGLIAAADTFRAAAGDQLEEWANRAGVDMIGRKGGSDPASVVFDAVNAAQRQRHVDVLLCDTAGRLHNKKNLMEELRKMNRIIDQGISQCP